MTKQNTTEKARAKAEFAQIVHPVCQGNELRRLYWLTDQEYAQLEAAPELLAALKIAMRALQDHNIDELMSGEYEILTDAIARARAEWGQP